MKMKEGRSKTKKGGIMNRKLVLGLGVLLIGLAILVGVVNVSQAAFRVDNTARLVYFSNATLNPLYSYAMADTARLIVLYGPSMWLEKYAKNEVTGDTSTNQVPVNKGDSVTVYLYAANDSLLSDTAAWGVTIYDTFSIFAAVDTYTASVGPAANDSFTYVAGTETVVYEIDANSVCLPDFIAYYDGSAWSAWQPYASKNESVFGSPADIRGIKWSWNYVPSKMFYDSTSAGMVSTGKPYRAQVKFSLLKNFN